MTENLEEGSLKENRTPYLVFSQSFSVLLTTISPPPGLMT